MRKTIVLSHKSCSVQKKTLYSAANDPQTGNDPQIGPQMIPKLDRK